MFQTKGADLNAM